MTPADKLRELLATRPAQPNIEELVRWWRTGAELVNELLASMNELGPAVGALFADRAHRGSTIDELRAAVDVLKQEVRELEQQRDTARTAARALIAQVEHLAAFADDSDPRVMATAAPLGAAQADLWLALGLSLDEEHARMQADIDSRCAVCGWQMADPIKGTAGFMCRPGDCSLRPPPEKLYAPERAKREAEELHERAVLAGMPPSGRWA